MILSGVGAAGAAQRAECFARALREGVFALQDQHLPLPTVSCGVATYGVDGDRAVALMAAADQRMYREKAGRGGTRRVGDAVTATGAAIGDAAQPVSFVHFNRGGRRPAADGSNYDQTDRGEALGAVVQSER